MINKNVCNTSNKIIDDSDMDNNPTKYLSHEKKYNMDDVLIKIINSYEGKNMGTNDRPLDNCQVIAWDAHENGWVNTTYLATVKYTDRYPRWFNPPAPPDLEWEKAWRKIEDHPWIKAMESGQVRIGFQYGWEAMKKKNMVINESEDKTIDDPQKLDKENKNERKLSCQEVYKNAYQKLKDDKAMIRENVIEQMSTNEILYELKKRIAYQSSRDGRDILTDKIFDIINDFPAKRFPSAVAGWIEFYPDKINYIGKLEKDNEHLFCVGTQFGGGKGSYVAHMPKRVIDHLVKMVNITNLPFDIRPKKTF